MSCLYSYTKIENDFLDITQKRENQDEFYKFSDKFKTKTGISFIKSAFSTNQNEGGSEGVYVGMRK